MVRQTAAAIPGKQDPTAIEKTAVPQRPAEVVLDTTLGSITIRLNAEKSPKTVENFLAYVDSHFYEGTLFIRYIKIRVL